MQRPALSMLTVEVAEALHDDYMARQADGVIDATDIVYLTPQIVLVMQMTQQTDHAQATGLAMIRTGADGYRTKVLLRDVSAPATFEPEAA